MVNEIKFTLQSLKVLGIFCNYSGKKFSGSDISKKTNFPSGTVYPMLGRLENAGLLKSRWEKADPREIKRPRKRIYDVTNLGLKRFQFESSRHSF